MYICINVGMHACMYVYMYTCRYACVYVCIYVLCRYACVYVCIEKPFTCKISGSFIFLVPGFDNKWKKMEENLDFMKSLVQVFVMKELGQTKQLITRQFSPFPPKSQLICSKQTRQ